MQETKLTKKQERVLNAFSGGRTIKEARQILRNEPEYRQLRNIMKMLMDADLLIDLDAGKCGAIPHRYIPASDSFGEIVPWEEDSYDFDYEQAFDSICERIQDAITVINASSRSRTPRRIQRICNEKIKPLIQDIYLLRGANIYLEASRPVIVPGEYFTDGWEAYKEFFPDWRRKKIIRGHKGTIRVRHPESSSEDDWFYPTIEEWKDYLEFMKLDLNCEMRKVVRAIEESAKQRDAQSGPKKTPK
ncbi:MAG: hypothetical protein QXT42_03360 [Thermoplasmata archaeon]